MLSRIQVVVRTVMLLTLICLMELKGHHEEGQHVSVSLFDTQDKRQGKST